MRASGSSKEMERLTTIHIHIHMHTWGDTGENLVHRLHQGGVGGITCLAFGRRFETARLRLRMMNMIILFTLSGNDTAVSNTVSKSHGVITDNIMYFVETGASPHTSRHIPYSTTESDGVSRGEINS